MKTSSRTENGKTYIMARITNRGKGVAFAIRVMPVYASSGEQVLPAIMDDNYFTLLKGESKTVTVEFDSSILGDDSCRIVARAYND